MARWHMRLDTQPKGLLRENPTPYRDRGGVDCSCDVISPIGAVSLNMESRKFMVRGPTFSVAHSASALDDMGLANKYP